MSRPIKLTQELIDECRQDFEKALSLTKLSDGKLSFTKAFSCGDRKAVVYFSAEAWAKMTMLIKEFDKEVAWHGVARRTEDESLDEYVIDDIVVYPQEEPAQRLRWTPRNMLCGFRKTSKMSVSATSICRDIPM